MSELGCSIRKLATADLDAPLLRQIEAIFWQTSAQTHAPGPARDAFRERWLGRYLLGGSDIVLVAMEGETTVAGYLVGALQNPARQSRFADIGYYRADFADLTAQFPAHLHINLDQRFRSRGIGAILIEEFVRHAKLAGAPGVHVTTGKGVRNTRFYARCGFEELGSTMWNGRAVVFLGRRIL
jgi:GNAT superfamily N-acetyltransferase